ncbi:MAG: HEAT repeat domain-containing protein [Blastocatellia bacterium]
MRTNISCCISSSRIALLFTLLFTLPYITSGQVPESTDDLIKKLDHTKYNDLIRRTATSELASRKEEAKKVVPALIDSVKKDPDNSVRSNAISSLGAMKKNAIPAIDILIHVLDNKNENVQVREAAAFALGEINEDTETVVASLSKALREEPSPQDDITKHVRSNAAGAMESMKSHAKEILPVLSEALQKDPDPEVRSKSADIIVQLCDTLNKLQDVKALPVLKSIQKDLQNNPTDENEYAVSKITSTINTLGWIGRATFFKYLESHPYLSLVIIAYFLLLIVIVLLLWIYPLWLLRVNETLAPITDISLPKPFDFIKLPVRHLLLLGFFHYHPRVLDSWVSKYINKARERFENMPIVSERKIYVPVTIGMGNKTLSSLTATEVRQVFERNISHLLIFGEGGAGKTSLACELGKLSMEQNISRRLCPSHFMLPLLIEQDLETQQANQENVLLYKTQSLLRVLIEEKDMPSPLLVSHLLKQRRVLLIIDSLSEMTSNSRISIIDGISNIPANAVIVTSRIKAHLGDLQPKAFSPLRITRDTLPTFMKLYLKHKEMLKLASGPKFEEVSRKLSLFGKDAEITALLAKLYVDQFIAAVEDTKEGRAIDQLPENIPDLMINSISILNRRPPLDAPETRIVIIAAKALAWACLKPTLQPGSVSYKKALAALRRKEVSDELRGLDVPSSYMNEARRRSIIDYLDQNLNLIKISDNGIDRIRFTLDPLSEYLAAIRLMGKYRDDRKAWCKLLYKVQRSDRAAIEGFLLALHNCYLIKSTEFHVPDFVGSELSDLLNVNRKAFHKAEQP